MSTIYISGKGTPASCWLYITYKRFCNINLMYNIALLALLTGKQANQWTSELYGEWYGLLKNKLTEDC